MVPATIHRDSLIDGSMDGSSLGIDRAIHHSMAVLVYSIT